MIYLDNSSTTHKKPHSVITAVKKGLTKYSVNPSRGAYKLSIEAENLVYQTRELLANYVGTTAEQVIFTSGCTMALNLALFGTIKKGGHILISPFEHNSIMRPLERLKSTHNITYTILNPNKNGLITPSEISNNIKPNTYMVIINHTSNVTGTTQNLESIGKACKKHNLIFMVDGAQSVGHEFINMQEMGINLLAIAGHKGLYAPQGIGVLAINNVEVSPLIYGGTGTSSDRYKQPTTYPDGLESGTPNLPAIIGLKAGTEFVIKNQTNINKKISSLTKHLIYELNRIKNVTCYSNNENSGVVSFTIKNKDSSEVSTILSEKFDIATRSGLHCAPSVHKYLKTLKNGMTRISLSYFNKYSDIEKVLFAIKEIALN